jgi:hypothetical protein
MYPKYGFSQQICIKSSITNFTEIHPVGGRTIHADRLMEMMKAIGTFHNVPNPNQFMLLMVAPAVY